jgi:phage terminase large subunit
MEIQATVNYEFIDDNFESNRGLVLPGGTRSTKTISILQWLILYARKNHGSHIVVARDTLKNLKRTVLKDFIALCYGYGDYAAHDLNMVLNKSELIATVGNSTFEFIGLIDDPMRVHGLKSDIFYINEAIGTYKATFTQLNYRCSEGWILDCNPSEPMHWVYELESREDVAFYRSSYLDNPFLNEAQVFEIECKEPTPENIEQGTADEREWSIYGKGLVYKGKEIIYPNWNTYSGVIEEYDQIFYGLDWGINHPLACIEVKQNGNNLYVREIVYKSGIKDIETQLVPILMQEPPIASGETYVICDSAEEKSIHTLIRNNVTAFGVKKPPGSVLTGIRKVAKYNLFVHEDSANIQTELNRYKWKVDQRTDTILDVPVKLWDDAMDAIRYVVYTYL